ALNQIPCSVVLPAPTITVATGLDRRPRNLVVVRILATDALGDTGDDARSRFGEHEREAAKALAVERKHEEHVRDAPDGDGGDAHLTRAEGRLVREVSSTVRGSAPPHLPG